MAPSFAVRPATPKDAAKVDAVLSASFPKLMQQAYSPEVLEAALPMLTRSQLPLLQSGRFFVAERSEPGQEAQIVACGGWSLERPGYGEVVQGLGHLCHFAVHPDCMGKALGRRIFEACVEQARQEGIQDFECFSTLPAEGFYAKLGLRTVGDKEVMLRGVLPFPSKVMTTLTASAS
ncbi:unnamed protein product [Effrenium voratum]|nr:unnamed protein product [Effrenium voratum]|eukprot:CAMPEP_0181423844 /NCGR_PEP_ID=MMETSP1110-20121109/14337_1 /TAXON_ID=174948 /ORGANISM="Symbiodinium sp., Strain CCMP421" /LENGTH=176 /DNA_ID=CAMNT_0023546981 /DNA_START=100 /DNA_END=630 /DNA_ORIENTATION=-